MKDQFIGEKKIKSHKQTKETTPGGTPIIMVEYDNGLVEHFSKLMFDNILADEPYKFEELARRRVEPVMQQTLMILREWGLKAGEFSFFSGLLNQQLEFNKNSAYIKLVSQYMPEPLSLEDVDTVTLDRILKNVPSKK